MNAKMPPRYFQEVILMGNFDELFALYGRLVVPVQEYEETENRILQAENAAIQARATISSAYARPFWKAASLTFLLAIPFAIAFVIILNMNTNAEGVKWFTLYDEWFSSTWMYDSYEALSYKAESLPMLIALLCGLLLLLIMLFVALVVIPAACLLFPALLVINIISTIFSVMAAKRMLAVKQQEIEELHVELEARFDDLTVPLTFVPPDYRSSHALSYFYNSYVNGRARTLQTAIAAYDTYLHQKRLELGELDLMIAQSEDLRAIAYQAAQVNRLSEKFD